MENVSKALIMAGSMLIALMVVGALILMFNNLSSYQQSNVNANQDAQVVEFNNQFVTYDRKDVRGSDLISLMNKVVDYNLRKTEDGYAKMEIKIQGIKTAELKFSETNLLIMKADYNQDDLPKPESFLSIAKNLEGTYGANYIMKLSANIQNIVNNDKAEENAEKILPKELSKYGGIATIQEDTKKYYEYSQLKRTYFNCTESVYDEKTGRINSMTFEYQRIGE